MFDLSKFNTFGLQVHAKDGIIIESEADLRKVHTDRSITLGHGSDVLFTDDYNGTVLINQIKSLSIELKDGKYIVRAGAGLVLDELISYLVNKGIYGLENLSLVPGTVGAAPIQNVGAYGVEVGDLISEVVVYDLQRHITESFPKLKCDFGYRTSYFKQHKERKLFITKVVFELSSEFSPKLQYKGLAEEEFKTALDLRNRIIELRNKKLPDPKLVGNAGSFFKNPVVSFETAHRIRAQYPDLPMYPAIEGDCKLAAGWLIEKSGCKGITHGCVGTWESQALVIVNRGGAKPHEIVALAKYIMTEVYNRFEVKLEPEVRTFDANGEVSWDNL